MESGVDLGGPRREFFRLLVFETSTTYFIGKEGHKFFLTDMKALQVFNTIFKLYLIIIDIF
jgi:hypothetical protein